MKAKTVGTMLAAGLFVIALFLTWFSGEKKSSPKRETEAARITDHAPATGRQRTDHPPAGATPPGTTPTAPKFSPALPATGAVAARQTPRPDGGADSPPGNPTTTQPRDAQVDVNKVHLMVRDYHTLMGENPVGTNAEIMQALMGHNPKQATVGPPEGMSLNGKGELVDQWGTPYFFHQISGDVMEIHSAGPDKVMGTADDMVVR